MLTFDILAAYATVESYSDYADSTDSLFRNIPARVAYETFIWVVLEAANTTSIILVARKGACMTFAIEDIQCCLKGVLHGDSELHVLKKR